MISTLKADITGLDFDIIVNAANSNLSSGAGVCGAIFSKAGKGLEEECQKIGHCQVGQAVITDAYELLCKAVIHTVGPVYKDGKHNEADFLSACYWNSLSLAYNYLRTHEMERLTLAFPCISTGIYGYPNEEACKIAVSTVKKLMSQYPDAQAIDVIFVCYMEKDYMLYKEELRKNEINRRSIA